MIILTLPKKASCRLGFPRKSKINISPFLTLIYKLFITLLLEYHSHMWAGAPPT